MPTNIGTIRVSLLSVGTMFRRIALYSVAGGEKLSTTHHTSVMGLHLPCSTSKTPTF